MNTDLSFCSKKVGTNTKIFIADDDKEMRIVIKEMLSNDFDITLFENGKVLIDYIGKMDVKPDLYILDMMMPQLNGIETGKLIRKRDKSTPIIAMSGDLNDSYYKSLFEIGFNEAIPKPFSLEVLYAKIKNALDNTLIPSYKNLIDVITLTMASMAEARDTLTYNHTLRIGEISYILAQEFGFKNQLCEDLRLASRLHDMGKISIKDEILQKPGTLTSEEFEYMKTHTTNGAVMLDGIASESSFNFLKLASEIALSHHEKIDGSGYPDGIKGEQIPLCVRFVTIADIYDGVTMQRPYHEKKPHEEGVKVLEDERNKGKIDGDIVSAFKKRESDIKEIKALFS